jgi:hypothetical protein
VPRQAFVEPATIKLELTEGDWIEVKRELTYGEQLKLQDESSRTGEDDKLHFAYSSFYVAHLAAWIVDWSFEDANGHVEVTPDSIRALKGAIAGEINTALNKYEAEQDALKNAMTPG